MEKEYVPFKDRKGLKVWPDGKTFAVAFYLAVEEWDDDSPDYTQPPPLAPPILPHMKRPDLAIRSSIEYGYRVGVWRIMEMLEQHAINVTIIANGLACETHPELFREFAAKGYDFVAHGFDQCRLFTQLPREEQERDIDRCVKVFKDVANVEIKAWGSPWARQYQSTLELLADRKFFFHQGMHDDELPYYLHFKNHTLVEVPYRLTESGELNDYWMYRATDNFVGDDAFEYCRALIDARYRDSAIRPQLLVIGSHPEVTGRPDHVETLSQVIGYLKTLPNVWLTTMGGMANRWSQIAGSLPVKMVRENY